MTPTLLPLYTFAKRLGLHPLHAMGVDANIGSAASRVCVHPIAQLSWQDADGVSREELSQAIFDAEYEIATELGYWPAPRWDAVERHELVDYPGSWFASGYDIRGDRISTKLQYGEVISGGRVQKTAISTGEAVAYTDLDSDTYKETATIGPIATTVTDPEEIALYYPTLSGDDEWEIRPITATIAAGQVTITCRREQLVKKELLEALEWQAVSGTTDTNFLSTVDVYRKYNDPSTQVQLVWRDPGLMDLYYCSCNGTGCSACGLTIQNGCMTVKDKRLGIVTVESAEWNTDDQVFDCSTFDVCRRPDYIRAWYRSGYRDMSLATPNTQMAREFELAVTKLAISKLDRNICSCKAVADTQAHWNTDLRRSRSTRESSQSLRVTNYELENCPFGTTVAALDVWRLIRRRTNGVPA